MKKIIVRMPNWLGDAVIATPILADLRQAYPDAHITAMILAPLAPLLLGNPHINEIFTFSKKNDFLSERLEEGAYDLGILLTNSPSSAFLFWKGRVKKRVGFSANFRFFFLTERIPFPKERGKEHLVKTYKRILKPLGISLSNTPPEIFVSDDEKQEILKKYCLNKPIIGVSPLSAYGPAKNWPEERFREFAIKILDESPKATLLFLGDKAGIPAISRICEGLPLINLAGSTTLRELIVLLSICRLFVTNDSGPMHIASALGIPTIALFGSTCPTTTGPYSHGHVIRKKVPCAPCFLRTCPLDFRCMREISSDEVAEQVHRILRPLHNSKG